VGGFEEFTATGVVRGWARDPDLPNGAIDVYFYIDGPMSSATYRGSTTANLPGKPGTSSENHAFAWRIPEPTAQYNYRDGQPHTLYVYAIDCSGLKRDSPLLTQRTFVLPPGNELPLGALEKLDVNGGVTGWAVDPNSGMQALTVSFYVGDSLKNTVLAGQVYASLPRPDVNEATGCPGSHGFQWSIPSQFRDGMIHKLYAYVNDTTTQGRVLLNGSGMLFALQPVDDV
jgi:hypothetical protein